MLRALAVAAIVSLFGAASAAAQGTPTQGEKVYAAQKCGLCHAIDGKGNLKGPLDEAVGKLSAADIRAWITDANAMTAKTKATRKPDMKSYTLPADELDAVVAYMMSLKK